MKIILKSLIILSIFGVFSWGEESCDMSLFTISTAEKGVSILDVINKLSKECKYSIIVKDRKAEATLNKKLPSLYLNELGVDDIFSIVLGESGLDYEFDGEMLKIGYLVTKTFNVDFINTRRTGESSTNIVITGEKVGSAGTGGGGGESGGDSKTTITSSDGIDFWEATLLNEIEGILNRPEDTITTTNAEGIDTQEVPNSGSIVINKSAGLITVTGNKRQVDRVEHYISRLMERLKNQVMIDVSILNVKHSKSSSTGVNWSNFSATFGTKSGERYSSDKLFNYDNPFSFTTAGWDVSLEMVVDFLQGYGEVSSVSNPKVLTLNNQPSLISVGSIFYYKEVSGGTVSADGGVSTNPDVTYTPLFVGVLLDITPSVYGDEIMLKINPTVTKTKGVNIETSETALEEPPNLDSNQLSSIIKVKDGQKIILGGLISKSKSDDINKVPILGDIPLLGYAFKNKRIIDNVEEMVIVITPKIVKTQETFSLSEMGYVDIKIDGNE